ncbi:MAG: hypothetical protein WCP29_17295 [Acidobacteriota bacterium]
MRFHAAAISAALVVTLAAGVDARERNIDAPHLRSLDQAAGELLVTAQQKSATVRDLVAKLENSNLVAYIHVAPGANGTLGSGLSFVGASTKQRFVLISIASGASADRQIELLGHELQHASEVASASWVASDAQFQSLLAMVGWRDGTRARGYETMAANQAERQVRRELQAVGGTRQ